MASIKGTRQQGPRVDAPRKRGFWGITWLACDFFGVVRQLTEAKLFHKRQNIDAKGPAQFLLQPVPESL